MDSTTVKMYNGEMCSMSSYEKRLDSYKHWPVQIYPNMYQLAEAGLYYTGEGDAVKCCCCGTVISQWWRTDNAWAEHYKWSPDCLYLKMIGYGHRQCDYKKQNKRIYILYGLTQNSKAATEFQW